MDNIHFFKEDSSFDLRKLKRHRKWLTQIAISYHYQIEQLNYVFCSDEYLHKINMEYLNHDTYTDIITFDLREIQSECIESDVFISIERVTENAKTLGTEYMYELSRVMAHGLLHLMGFQDKTERQKQEMRLAEDQALQSL